MVDDMLKIINLGIQMAENNSGFPLLMQGQMGQSPELVGVVNVLDKNKGKYGLATLCVGQGQGVATIFESL